MMHILKQTDVVIYIQVILNCIKYLISNTVDLTIFASLLLFTWQVVLHL